MRGIAIDYDVTVSLHNNGDRWNFLGNPFNKDVNVTSFSADGDYVQTVQIWQDATGVAGAGEHSSGYWLLSSSPELGNRVPAGSGFMLLNTNATQLTIPASGRIPDAAQEKRQQLSGIFFALSADDVVLDKSAAIIFDNSGSNAAGNHVPKLAPLGQTGGQIALIQQTSDTLVYLAQLNMDMTDFGQGMLC
jgi:hypothetical protein